MKNIIKTFDANTRGRDFVVGDIHGCRPLLDKFMQEVNFDYGVDRMFSVGDLEDRGPESLRSLELIDQPWFHAVMANHEQMMYEAFNGGYMGSFWLQNGGTWGYTALEEANKLKRDPNFVVSDETMRVLELLEKVDELPFLITINMVDGRKFHVIHAEFPPGHELTDNVLASENNVRKLAEENSYDGQHILWGRNIFYHFYGTTLSNHDKVKRTVAHMFRNTNGPFNKNLSHIICGHSIMTEPLTILGQTNIDTGAHYSMKENPKGWAGLTVVELNTWTFYKTTPTTFEVVESVVVNIEDIEAIKRGDSSEGTS